MASILSEVLGKEDKGSAAQDLDLQERSGSSHKDFNSEIDDFELWRSQ